MGATIVTDVRPLMAALRTGASAAEIGRWLGVSRERVRQIWVRESGQAHVPDRRAKRDFSTIRLRRFWACVSIHESGCWGWTGKRYPTGYGIPPFRTGGYGAGYAHRFAYVAFKGAIPDGLTIDHLCRNRGCVNPAHLEAVTQRENTMRSPIAPAAINSRKTHCKHGHEFNDLNTRRWIAKNGQTQRACRVCARDKYHQLRRERTAA